MEIEVESARRGQEEKEKMTLFYDLSEAIRVDLRVEVGRQELPDELDDLGVAGADSRVHEFRVELVRLLPLEEVGPGQLELLNVL